MYCTRTYRKPTGCIRNYGHQYGKEIEEKRMWTAMYMPESVIQSVERIAKKEKRKPGFRVTNRNNDDFGWGDESDEEPLVHTNQPI